MAASVFVAVPYTRPWYGISMQSVLFSYPPPGGLIFKQEYGKAIPDARNFLTECYKIPSSDVGQVCDFILYLDNDATFHPQALNRLVEHDLPMVCGCMYTKDTIPPRPTPGKYVGFSEGKHYYRYGETAKAILNKAWEHGYNTENDIESNAALFPQTKTDLFSIDGCGMHFTLVRRDVIEALDQPVFKFVGDMFGGEDFYFCQRVKDAGFPIYLDLSVQTGHAVGETTDLGIRELLAYTKYLDKDTIEFTDENMPPLEIG